MSSIAPKAWKGSKETCWEDDWPGWEAPDVDVAVDGVIAQGVVPESADQGLGLAEIVNTESDPGTQQRYTNPEKNIFLFFIVNFFIFFLYVIYIVYCNVM